MKNGKTENILQSIYKDKGYDIICDNRSYFTKSLNKAISNNNVTFQLCEKGKVWVGNEDYRFNLRIKIGKYGYTWKLKDFTPETLCSKFALVAQMPEVKEYIHIYQDAYECDKCHGKGIIKAFMHVCKGVCFDCLGIGYKFHSMNHK